MRALTCAFGHSLFLMLLALTGCNTLSDVQSELAKGGYMLWYPARVGVEPGQIWIIDGNQKVPFLDRPSQVTMTTSTAQFESLTKAIDANASLNATFSTGVGGDADQLQIALTKATVTNVTLSLGNTVIDEIALGTLINNLSQYPQNYQQAIQAIQSGTSDKVLLASVVRASGMTYTFTCTDTNALQAQLPTLQSLVNANINLQIKSNTQAVWNIPSSESLTIGFTPVKGAWISSSPQQLRANIKQQLKTLNQRSILGLLAHKPQLIVK